METIKPRLLTSADRDKLLAFLVENITPEENKFDGVDPYVENTGLNVKELNQLFHRFNDDGLLSYKGLSAGSICIEFMLKDRAQHFFSKGGYTVQDEILKKEIEKLNAEIEKLKGSLEATTSTGITLISNLTSIAANIASVVLKTS